MIQRIQTLYLLVAALGTFSLLFIPFGTVVTDLYAFTFDAFALQDITPDHQTAFSTFYIAILLVVSSVLSLSTIFLYKNRPRQITLVYVDLLIFLFSIALILFIYPDVVFLKKGLMLEADIFNYNPWMLLPFFLTVLSLFLAYRAIKKDEKLVRAADRLRS